MKANFTPRTNGLVQPKSGRCIPSFSLLLVLWWLVFAKTGLAQHLDPVPPAEGLPIERQIYLLRNRLYHPPQPRGGSWVITEEADGKTPVVVNYYTAQQYLISTDTLGVKRLDIHRRAVVYRLNKRLIKLLDAYPATNLSVRKSIR